MEIDIGIISGLLIWSLTLQPFRFCFGDLEVFVGLHPLSAALKWGEKEANVHSLPFRVAQELSFILNDFPILHNKPLAAFVFCGKQSSCGVSFCRDNFSSKTRRMYQIFIQRGQLMKALGVFQVLFTKQIQTVICLHFCVVRSICSFFPFFSACENGVKLPLALMRW